MNTVAVEVRPSKIHGKGVFALRDIKAGEFVCVYDGELLNTTDMEYNDDEDGAYYLAHPKNPTLVVSGYKYPKNRMGVGQLINDAKQIELSALNYEEGITTCRRYMKESKEMVNVDFKSDENFHIHAIRDIMEGEELFIYYGYPYWLGKLLNKDLIHSSQFLWRLLCHCLLGEVQMYLGESIDIGEALLHHDESKCKKIIDRLEIPSYILEVREQAVPYLTYYDSLWCLLRKLNIDCIETYLDARKKK